MRVAHRIAIAAILGASAVGGTVALSKTTHLGADVKTTPVDPAAVAARNRELAAAELAAQRALEQRPPSLPKVPKGAVEIPVLPPIVVTKVVAAGGSATRSASAPRSTRRATSRRPAASTRPRHRDNESREHEDESVEHDGEQARDTATTRDEGDD